MTAEAAGPTPRLADGPADARPAAERIAEALRGLILAGAFGPGERLPGEQALAARFGVSRPTLREALTRLAAQNLVRTRRGAGGGSFVAAPGWAEAAEQVAACAALMARHAPLAADCAAEARLVLLRAALPLAAERRTEDQLARMRAEVALQRAEGTGDAAFCASDTRFHRTLAEATGNPLLALLVAGGTGAMQPALATIAWAGRDRAEIAARHARIVAMLERRDAAGLGREVEALAAATARLVREAETPRAPRPG